MIQPLNDQLIVKPLKKEEEIIRGIIIPETTNANLSEGIVVHVSHDVTGVKVGDKVVFPSGCGQGQILNQEPHLWLKLTELWGIVNPD